MIFIINSPKYGKREVLIDKDDLKRIENRSWCLNNPKRGRFYVRSSAHVLLHRFIMGNPAGKEVDHINGNTLDNRKINLRICAQRDNAKNRAINKNSSSGYRGVYWDAESGKWAVAISFNKTRIKVGRFTTKEEAALAYNKAAYKYHGEFARLNEVTK